MKIYRKYNSIVVEDNSSEIEIFARDYKFTDDELKELLNNKEIFDYLCYRLSFVGYIYFQINERQIEINRNEFINQVKKSKLPILEKAKIFRINYLEKTNKSKYVDKLLSGNFGKLTGYEVIDIYLSSNPIEMCKAKGITFGEFINIIKFDPFNFTSINNRDDKKIQDLFPIPKLINDKDSHERNDFYYELSCGLPNDKLPFTSIVDLYTSDFEELKRRIEKAGFTLEEFANKLEMFPNINFGMTWAMENIAGYKEMIKDLNYIWNNYARGRSPIKSNKKFKYMENNISEEIVKQFLDELESLKGYNLTEIQKAYYLYRRLCQKFSYDDEVYVTHEARNRKPHGKLERASEFDFKNNLVVCYDINFMFAKLCQIVGLHAELRERGYEQNWHYTGDGFDRHPYVYVWADDVVIKADASNGKLNNDMAKEKVGEKLEDFICLTSGPKYKRQFERDIELVDQLLATRQKDYEYYDIEEMLKKHSETEQVTAEEVESTFIDIIKEINEIPGTMMGKNKAVLDIIHRFNYRYRMDFKVAFVCDSNPLEENKGSSLAYVISIKYGKEYSYYFVKQLGQVEKISKEELTEMINSGSIEEVDTYKGKIPGI